MVLINLPTDEISQYKRKVSVPLRGLWFLSFNPNDDYFHFNACFRPLTGIMVLIMTREEAIRNYVEYVSVPLRGLWFLSAEILSKQGTSSSFPSPYGDYGSYRHEDSHTVVEKEMR